MAGAQGGSASLRGGLQASSGLPSSTPIGEIRNPKNHVSNSQLHIPQPHRLSSSFSGPSGFIQQRRASLIRQIRKFLDGTEARGALP